MASLRKESDRGRTGWRLQFRHDGDRRSLWLGGINKRQADTIARHVEELADAFAKNMPASPEAVNWANDLAVDGRLYSTLLKWRLVEPRQAINPLDRVCKTFFERLIAERWEGRTATNYKQGARSFVEHFGNDRTLASISPAEFDAWHRWMVKQGLAKATANKRAKMVKTMLKEAVRARIIAESPASESKIGGEVNRSRDHYVTLADTSAILEKCDVEWAVIFGLCRYAGFRCPSEVQALTWADVLWDLSRLKIESPKTGLRFCPIFAPLRDILNRAWDAASEGDKYVVTRYRDTQSNLRTQFQRIVKSAGVVPWAKPFVNCRASCRTDLEELFPGHVIDGWLGHSSRIAADHYLQTTDGHWERAASETIFAVQDANGGVAGGVIPASPECSGVINEAENTAERSPVIIPDYQGLHNQYAQQDSNLRPTD